jgi:hypothetical protein
MEPAGPTSQPARTEPTARPPAAAASSERIRIEKYLTKDLVRAVETLNQPQEGRTPMVVLPPHAAVASANNPAADERDVGLLVAFKGNQPIGYVGLMPGHLCSGNQRFKVHWLTAWYVPDEHRQSAAGAMLMMTAIGLRYHLLASAAEMSEQARHVYKQLGFAALGPLPYARLDCDRPNPLQLPVRAAKKLADARNVRVPGIGRAGMIATQLYASRRRAHWKKLRSGMAEPRDAVTIEEVTSFSDEMLSSLPPSPRPNFCRDAAVLNWMLNHKWILSDAAGDYRIKGYYFGGSVSEFRYVPLVLRHKGSNRIAGLCILSVSRDRTRTTLKMLDCHVADETVKPLVLAIALEYAEKLGASVLNIPADWMPLISNQALLAEIASVGSIYYFAKAASQPLDVGALLKQAELRLADGDMAFS